LNNQGLSLRLDRKKICLIRINLRWPSLVYGLLVMRLVTDLYPR
ncbi:unnamed protein product, partial [Brassica napus]